MSLEPQMESESGQQHKAVLNGCFKDCHIRAPLLCLKEPSWNIGYYNQFGQMWHHNDCFVAVFSTVFTVFYFSVLQAYLYFFLLLCMTVFCIEAADMEKWPDVPRLGDTHGGGRSLHNITLSGFYDDDEDMYG